MSTAAHDKKSGKFSFQSADQAIMALCDQVKPVDIQQVASCDAAGTILAKPVTLDRPSPACNVSAMDGYALRMTDARPGELPVSGEIQAGQPACDLPPGSAVRIFTGGMIPPQADLVIQREHVQEQPQSIILP